MGWVVADYMRFCDGGVWGMGYLRMVVKVECHPEHPEPRTKWRGSFHPK